MLLTGFSHPSESRSFFQSTTVDETQPWQRTAIPRGLQTFTGKLEKTLENDCEWEPGKRIPAPAHSVMSSITLDKLFKVYQCKIKSVSLFLRAKLVVQQIFCLSKFHMNNIHITTLRIPWGAHEA